MRKNVVLTFEGQVNIFLYNPQNILIYSSITEASSVGSVMAPILKAIPVNPPDIQRIGYQEQESKILQYQPVNTLGPTNIHIQLKDAAGEDVKFVFSDNKVYISLVFRKIR